MQQQKLKNKMTNMNKQTAVEWLIEQINGKGFRDITIDIPKEMIEQAKEMDKEQKKTLFECGRQYQLTGEGTFTQVYQELYGTE
jgi:hypothetical protein